MLSAIANTRFPAVKVTTPGPTLYHRARHIDSYQARELDRIKILRQSSTALIVDRIHARGRNPYQHLAPARNRVRVLFPLEYFRSAIFVDDNCFHLLSP